MAEDHSVPNTLDRPVSVEGLFAEHVTADQSLKIVAALPDGRARPLVWLHGYDVGPIAMLLSEAQPWGIGTNELVPLLEGASPSTSEPVRLLAFNACYNLDATIAQRAGSFGRCCAASAGSRITTISKCSTQ